MARYPIDTNGGINLMDDHRIQGPICLFSYVKDQSVSVFQRRGPKLYFVFLFSIFGSTVIHQKGPK